MSDRLSALEQAIGITFHNRTLLQTAFLHRSLFNEQPHLHTHLTDNERLEFLGDSVLHFITTTWLFTNFPNQNEAVLTRWRAALVSTSTLAEYGRQLQLGRYVLLSRGEDSPRGRNRPALLADLFEALIGAIYLDQGLETVQAFVLPFLQQRINTCQQEEFDPITRLQERLQARYKITPVYQTVAANGPEHEREYVMAVVVEGQKYFGKGPRKKEAKREAARAALAALVEREEQCST